MRIRQLDVLRGIAVLLVLGRHKFLLGVWYAAGWIGVDLFFVLSGFLVSGLLFREYQREGQLHPFRFLMRRGLKIYPLFYVLILITAVLWETTPLQSSPFVALHETGFPKHAFLSELFFLQSYLPGMWVHTWSLAVEEHFYILLASGLYFLSRFRKTANPFDCLPRAIAYMVIITLIVRFATVFAFLTENPMRTYTPTHLRLDSLLLGVLLGYWYQFEPERWRRLASHKWLLGLTAAVLILPVALFSTENPVFYALQFTVLGVGFGALILIVVPDSEPLIKNQREGRNPIAFIGRYSYSIYLCHLPVAGWGCQWLHSVWPQLHYGYEFGFYLLASVVVGVAFSKMIELPIIHLRDCRLPSQPFLVPVQAQSGD